MVSSNGIEMGSQTDMLRLDALIMTVQLNLRKLLEVMRALHLISMNLLLRPCNRSCRVCQIVVPVSKLPSFQLPGLTADVKAGRFLFVSADPTKASPLPEDGHVLVLLLKY